MKVLRYYYEVAESPQDDNWWEDRNGCLIMDNRNEPVVRIGGESFECRYDFDYYECANFICDPSRSFVRPVYAAQNKEIATFWSFDGFVARLAQALGLMMNNTPGYSMLVSFWTMFPRFLMLSEYKQMMHCSAYNNQVAQILRVINNPFFYCNPNASETRLLQIAEDAGCAYAVDPANSYGSAETFAREIALLNHIHEGDAAVESAYGMILPQIASVLT